MNSTSGSSTADSYVSLSDANSYFSTHPQYSAWSPLTDAQKEIVLVAACRDLECLAYLGVKYTTSQALSFPRVYSTQPISVPQKIKWAQMEQALSLIPALTSSPSSRKKLQEEGVQSFSLGDLSETFSESRNPSRPLSAICSSARRFLVGWVRSSFLSVDRQYQNMYTVNYAGDE